MIRWQRMQGRPALWLPGADHAGIAAQNVVEKRAGRGGPDPPRPRARGVPGARLGVDGQLPRRASASSCAAWAPRATGRASASRWTRARRARCATVFKRLYDKGLIYRGERIINWCPRCRTALSDLEVEHEDEHGQPLARSRYPIDGRATTARSRSRRRAPRRCSATPAWPCIPTTSATPTCIGQARRSCRSSDRRDPDRRRRRGGHRVRHRRGEGDARRTTRTTSRSASATACRSINVMNLDGTMNDERRAVTPGMTRDEARKRVVAALRGATAAWSKIEPHTHAVGHCQRCDTVVEPLHLAAVVRAAWSRWPRRRSQAVRDGTRAHSCRSASTSVYLHWMENIRDWSHLAPALVGPPHPGLVLRRTAAQTIVADDGDARPPAPHCGSAEHRAGPRRARHLVLARASGRSRTLGWPDETPDLRRFYPTVGDGDRLRHHLLLGGAHDHVRARVHGRGAVPHRLPARHWCATSKARKMSKSKGNVDRPDSRSPTSTAPTRCASR